jgi:hypothetical protein
MVNWSIDGGRILVRDQSMTLSLICTLSNFNSNIMTYEYEGTDSLWTGINMDSFVKRLLKFKQCAQMSIQIRPDVDFESDYKITITSSGDASVAQHYTHEVYDTVYEFAGACCEFPNRPYPVRICLPTKLLHKLVQDLTSLAEIITIRCRPPNICELITPYSKHVLRPSTEVDVQCSVAVESTYRLRHFGKITKCIGLCKMVTLYIDGSTPRSDIPVQDLFVEYVVEGVGSLKFLLSAMCGSTD